MIRGSLGQVLKGQVWVFTESTAEFVRIDIDGVLDEVSELFEGGRLCDRYKMKRYV